MTRLRLLAPILVVFLSSPMVLAQTGDWITFTEETTERLISDPEVGISDTDEKDYEFGDVDQDGDVDLICVRKQPWMNTGRRRNVLFMNEGTAEGHPVDGVLVDRTVDYVTAADDGGQGFLDLTADRDCQLVDVDGDGWLDMVTSATFGQGLAKTISHPRVYINQGELGGVWLGFLYEEDRTPTLPIDPKFCGLGVGDVTGDGAPDLYFIDYENSLEDRLWINDGSGVFVDESTDRMTFEMRESEFGVFAVNADLNGDGAVDVIKCRSNGAPYRISISYNDPQNLGFFDDFDVVYSGAPYYVEVDDLNNDGLLDVVINDDGIDRYLLNQGNGGDGLANFSLFSFPSVSDGFSGRTIQADLDNDGFVDVMVADATVNGFGCNRHLDIWRNDGNPPSVTFTEESAGIPIADRNGTWDVAPMDLNGDGWLDLVIGTCFGTTIWMAEPPANLDFVYPEGQPQIVAPGAPYELTVDLEVFGVATIDPDLVLLHTSVNSGPWLAETMIPQSLERFVGTLPAVGCSDHLDYYVSAALEQGPVFLDPPAAPTNSYSTVAATGLVTAFFDDFESDVSGWSILGGPLPGQWEQAAPNGTILNGSQAAPPTDAGAGPDQLAFVTENGAPGAAASDSDVDGGPVSLVSASFDLGGTDAFISFDLWFFSALGTPDLLELFLSNDGGDSWVLVDSLEGTDSSWQPLTYLVSDHLSPTADVKVQFRVADSPNDSVTEAGLDNFRVEIVGCASFVRGDCNDDGIFGISDPILLLDFIFGSGSSVPCEDACDGNDSGNLELADAVGLLATLFTQGPAPAAPYPECGADPTDDGLDCGDGNACP